MKGFSSKFVPLNNCAGLKLYHWVLRKLRALPMNPFGEDQADADDSKMKMTITMLKHVKVCVLHQHGV